MFKFKIILLAIIAISLCSTCRTVQKTESKSSQKSSLDSNNTTLKHGLNELTTSSTAAEVTTWDYEYQEPTAEQKAKGDTVPKRRVKSKTKTVYHKQETTAKNDSTIANQTTVSKKTEKKQDDIQVVKKSGFPFWILIPVAIAIALILYAKYGNLFNLITKIFKK